MTSSVDFPQQAGEMIMGRFEIPRNVDSTDSNNPPDDRSPPPQEIVPYNPSSDRHLIKPLDRGGPGDPSLRAISTRTPEESHLTKRKSQFYSEVFAYRESHQTPRDKILHDSIITAELKTNIIISDEYTLLISLTTHLSTRYSRPPSSILIHLHHSACLLLGSSFDPAYLLTITALPTLLQPATNKRNAALIQTFLAEVLGVPAVRGVVRFVPIAEECLAVGGVTVAGEVERREGRRGRARSSVVPGEKREGSRKGVGKKRSGTLGEGGVPPVPKIPEGFAEGEGEEKARRMGRRKSIFNLWRG